MSPQPVSKYGGVPFSAGPVSKYGGVPVVTEQSTPDAPLTKPSPPGFVDRFLQAINPLPLFTQNPLKSLSGIMAPFAVAPSAESMAWGGHATTPEEMPGVQDLESGNLRGLAGTSTALLLPLLLAGGAKALPEGSVAKVGTIAKGGVKGGMESFTSGKSSIPAAAGATVGHMIAGPLGAEWGAALGALPGTIGGVARGIRDALQPGEIRSLPGGVMPPPAGARIPEITSSIPGGKMPPPPQTGTANPWEGRSIPGGRIPPPVQQSSPVSPWEGRSAPGGRMPPSAGVRAPTPEIPTVATPETTIKPIEGEATMGPKSDLAPIDKFEMNRMLHARAQETSLPGSLAGSNGHPNISAAAKENFGVDSASKMNVQQMRMLYDYLEKNGRFPVKGELPKL